MKQCDIKFRIDTDGYLLVSFDKGCTWENLGMVRGDASTVPGPQGPQGETGAAGADGANGADGNTPYINELTGTWWIGTTDTGVLAEGVNGEVDIEGSSDIAVVGTPSVTKRVVGNKTILKFHELKGERGDAPEITAERVEATNSVIFSVDGVPVVTLYDGIRYTAGSHIVITPIDNNHSTIACDLTAGEGITINNNNEICLTLTVPTEQNELIYSDDGTTLTTHQLMFTGGLVVDTPEDLDLCKEGADISMAKVASDWVKWGYYQADRDAWGYYASDETSTGNAMNSESPVYYFKDFTVGESPEGYIYNTRNTSYYSGYYSDETYVNYDALIAAGNLSAENPVTEGKITSNASGLTDFIGIVPVMYVDENDVDTDYRYCGITISPMNSNDLTNSRGGVNNGEHSVSLEIWHQSTITTSPSSSNTMSLLSRAEGLSIIPFKSGYDNSKIGQYASVRQVKIRKRDNIISMWFSDAYSTYDDDSLHTVFSDRPVVINLDNYTLSYTTSAGVLNTKDFSDTSNPPTGYTAAQVTVIKTVFDKLRAGNAARRGYEVFSNPGSIFRNVTSDELILDVTPGENKVYKFNGSTWGLLNTTPQQLFQNGSRIAWNRITDKLFYNDGASIYRIAAPDNLIAGYGLELEAKTMGLDTDVVNPTISSNAVTINYDSKRYVRISVHNDTVTTINVQMLAALSGTKKAREIICRIDNVDSSESSPATIKVAKTLASGASTGVLKNMYDVKATNGTGISLYNGDSMELCFTFWDKNDVTFNGGEEVAVL